MRRRSVRQTPNPTIYPLYDYRGGPKVRGSILGINTYVVALKYACETLFAPIISHKYRGAPRNLWDKVSTMRISELEKALKRGIMMQPGQPALAMLSADGASVPSEFADSAKSIVSREDQRFPGSDILQAAAAKWT